jgi:hypothetical protein
MTRISIALLIIVGISIVEVETAASWERHSVIPRPRVEALVVAGQRHLWGLRISRLLQDTRVKAWGRGFDRRGGPYPIGLREVAETSGRHTYKIPGGKRWAPAFVPEIVLSFSPTPDTQIHGLPALGRLYFGLLRQPREGEDTVLRGQRGNWCTATLSQGKRPPRTVNCVTGKFR